MYMIFDFRKSHEWWPFRSGDITIEFDFALAGWMQGGGMCVFDIGE